MRILVAAALLNVFVMAGFVLLAIPAHAVSIPCEEMLKEMRATKASAKLSDANKVKVDDLEAKAVERCNADDDTRSDQFSGEALKIMDNN